MTAPNYSAAKDVARANRRFYRAFENLDLESMRAVWLDDDRIRCVHPGGELLIGRRAVMASWEAIFAGTHAIRFEVSDLEVIVAGDFAWVSNIENVASSALPQRQALAATNLYLRRNDAWKMILHHASPVARRFFRG